MYLGQGGRKLSLGGTGTDNTDLLTMTCQNTNHNTDMMEGVDYILVSDNFLDRCIYDVKDQSKKEELRLTKKDGETIELKIVNIKATDDDRFGKISLKNAEIIINEYGFKVLDLRELAVGTVIDLEETYYTETRKVLGINEWVDGEE